MKEEDNLRERFSKLKIELENKEKENISLLDKIEHLEDTIIKYENIIGDSKSNINGVSSNKAIESKLKIEIEARNRHIRELKDNMGYLRMEKISLQRELENVKKQLSPSSVIRIEEKSPPLESLVKELQEKINKQEFLIKELKRKGLEKSEINELIKEKDNEINSLKSRVSKLIYQLENATILPSTQNRSAITKSLTEELQTKLNRAKTQIEDLKNKLSQYEGKDRKKQKKKGVFEEEGFNSEIIKLQGQLAIKEKKIEELSSQIGTKGKIIKEQLNLYTKGLSSTLADELQTKLNKEKLQIKSLQEQLNSYKNVNHQDFDLDREDIKKGLDEYKNKITQLEQKINFQAQLLDIKEEELGTIKNEAIQINSKRHDLENQLKLKEQTITKLKLQIENLQDEVKMPKEYRHLLLRVRELENLVEELKKR